jgi:3-oxoacyl-[acyl-carrier-protein] synthase III
MVAVVFINAIQLVDSMMHSGNLQKGLIVTADVEPIPGYSKGYNFAPIAAALILTPGEKEKGFVNFRSDTYLEYKDSFKGQLIFSETKQKSMITIDQTETYLDACLACTLDSIKKFLEADGLSFNDIDLIIPSQTPLGLPEALNQIPGLKDKTVMTDFAPGELHTAGPAYALEQIWNSQQFTRAQNILFATVSAGITTALALYRK